jgi:hypothetical protein
MLPLSRRRRAPGRYPPRLGPLAPSGFMGIRVADGIVRLKIARSRHGFPELPTTDWNQSDRNVLF